MKTTTIPILAATLSLGSILQGCAFAIPRSYVNPKEVSIPVAMEQAACGLSTFRNELARLQVNPGLLTDQVDVTMNLTASATGTGTLVLDTSTSNPVGILTPVGINYTDTTQTKGERGNQIKITLKNVYTAGLNEPGKTAVKRDGPRLNLGPTILEPRDLPCEAPPYVVAQGREAAAAVATGRSRQAQRPTIYILSCTRFGRPNIRIRVDPAKLSLDQQERACTGIDTLVEPSQGL